MLSIITGLMSPSFFTLWHHPNRLEFKIRILKSSYFIGIYKLISLYITMHNMR